MPRLVIVSNRVANLKKSSQSGGLAVAMADAVKESGGAWFGWDGEIVKDDSDVPEDAAVEDVGNVRVISTPLTRKDHKEYYEGFANSVLWPLFHYRLDLVDYHPEFTEGYLRVNRQFARQLAPHLKPDDLVWIQDYHLLTLARELRQLGCRQRIGFFLHIPFPPPDLFAAAPDHDELIESLLDCDVVGFQTRWDVNNIRHYLEDNTSVEVVDDETVRTADRSVHLAAFPISIDVGSFHEMAAEMPEDVQLDMMRNRILDRKQIIGVDRLDYTKGLPQRLMAVDRVLSQHPELEGRLSLLQIAPPTREGVSAYGEIRDELEGLTGKVNGKFADFNWTPIRYIHRMMPREKLAALYRASHVGLVTPLRDGMNLVAKEFVAAQDANDPGVLVLSQFAGAAEEMTDALIVNPYDTDDMAEKLYAALMMPLDERKTRHEALYDYLCENDSAHWLESYLRVLRGDGPSGSAATHDNGNSPGDVREAKMPPFANGNTATLN